ncbi:MAG: tripartite tricarboxylate transporter permease [Sphaerochaeta associata]|uniref:tripartite tricarboxylate transporter permease n=1 Tax=Sphaerochaeta associata TaxID=1129264 RepID=UPI002B201488|nr:tripartite tricarboxylate transporter permease [Sphaerochaeta associata]MEA5027422.1 tripartite tricarboxylate transporter permease [Sphaerochaeta associata]MEA5107489.1 tripartite tricarboxylate transporter permease [Sphaerochaeta associata]
MDTILASLGTIFQFTNIIGLIFGTGVGILIGAMPGLSVNMGIALLFPLTFSFSGIGGILMLIGIYIGAVYGGSISAILLNTPGTPASAATTLDGWPLAVKLKQPGRALGISTTASVFGGIFSAITLMLISPVLAKFALKFSKPEFFALAIFGISIISSLSSGSMIKGVLGGLIGLLLATVGIDAMSGQLRFTFNTIYLLGGVSFVPILIGLFAFSQALITIEETFGKPQDTIHINIERVLPTWKDFKKIFATLIRSSIIGTFIGTVPGTGGDISSFIAYDQAKKWSKHKEEFGKGAIEGIAAPESGNNSVTGGAFIPMLTLGIPGDGATAILLGALMVQGITPGPLLFKENIGTVYQIFFGLMIGNILMGIFGFSLQKLFAKVINIPNKILVPLIFSLTFVGSYSYNNSMTDVFIMIGAGIAGYFLRKFEFSMSAIIIGIILGKMAETNFRGALMMSDGSFSIFVLSPISLVLLIASLISLLSPFFGSLLSKRKRKN